MENKKVYNPTICDNEDCNKSFKKGDKVIRHDDVHTNWFFCCEECYQTWLKEYKVKTTIVVGEEMIEEESEEF